MLRRSHDRQLKLECTRLSTNRFKRSVFGLVALFNALPQWVVEIPQTKDFQRVLQGAVKRSAIRGNAEWADVLKYGWQTMSHDRVDSLFQRSDLRQCDRGTEVDIYYESNSESE